MQISYLINMRRLVRCYSILFAGLNALNVLSAVHGAPPANSIVSEEQPAALKKVIILDFKNLDKNPDYSYLEGSITDAVRSELKAKFDFRELSPKAWRALAQKNYFNWPEENYGRGFAINLGRLANQDIAVGGFFQAVADKKTVNSSVLQYTIRVHVFVVDIGKHKLVTEFDMTLAADATIFTSIETLSARVVKEAQRVLPNKGSSGQIFLDDDEDLGRHEFGLVAGTGIFSQPTAFLGNYTTDTALYTKDFATPIAVAAFYQYHDFLLPQLQLHVMGSAHFASNNFAVASDTKKIRSTMMDISAAAHLGYEWRLWRFGVTPLVGGGFSFANIELDYTTLSALPVTASGQTRSSAALNLSAPFAEGGLKLQFSITPRLFVNAYALYRQNFYVGQSVGQLFAAGGFSYRL